MTRKKKQKKKPEENKVESRVTTEHLRARGQRGQRCRLTPDVYERRWKCRLTMPSRGVQPLFPESKNKIDDATNLQKTTTKKQKKKERNKLFFNETANNRLFGPPEFSLVRYVFERKAGITLAGIKLETPRRLLREFSTADHVTQKVT